MRRQKDKCENAPVESLASERLLSALCAHAKRRRGDKKMKIQEYVNWIPPPTMGENHSFWLLKRFLIFQGISGDLDANLLKHISLKIQ